MTRTADPRDESGAGVVLAIMLSGVLVLVGLVASGVVAAVVTHRTAQAGADLAALAGAQAIQDGEDPCAEAGRIAGRNRTVVLTCAVDGWEVAVSVAADVPLLPGGRATLRARARAGPASLLPGQSS